MTSCLVKNFRRDVWGGMAWISLLGFAVANTLFRVINLGYSNFQGDEISAQEYLFGDGGILQFLLTRSKGPLQYLVSYAMNLIVHGKVDHPEGALRVPFALAGILSVGAIYLLGARYWSRRSGLIAAFLLAASGLFLAFSRIVQYQSFVVLLSILTYFEFLGYLEGGHARRLVVAGVLSGLALLFHYDGLGFSLPILLYLCAQCMRPMRGWRELAAYLVPLALVSGVFLVPYVIGTGFSSTMSYLLGERIISGSSSDAVSYSLQLLAVYHSREYLGLLLLGLVVLAVTRLRSGGHVVALLVATLAALIVARVIGAGRVGILVYASVLVAVVLIVGMLVRCVLTAERRQADVALTLWFLVAFTTYGLWFAKPLTHIYAFLAPLFLSLGMVLEPALRRFPRIGLVVALIAGISATSFNHQAFIDVTPEYPWNSKAYIFGSMSDAISSGEDVQGVFGFPYNRGWWEIRSTVEELGLSTYTSNEKLRLTRYYMRGLVWDEDSYDVYIWIDKPQSLKQDARPDGTQLAQGPGYILLAP